MKKYNVTLIYGDGIGPEIVESAVRVLDAAAENFGFEIQYTRAKMGGEAIDETGIPLPPETVSLCKAADAVLLGAVGGTKWETLPGNLRPEAGLLGIRAALGLFANLRPAKIFPSLINTSPLKSEIIGGGLDILVVRELTGGIYFGERGRGGDGIGAYAFDTEKYTKEEIVRIARRAFDSARLRNRHVTSVDKANVLESSRFWRETVADVAREYPDITLDNMYADNAAMQLVSNPHFFDVILTNNIFGDILSDEAATLTGSIGMLPSASLGEQYALYEPVHGSAPDIAGKGIANPLATVLSAVMMLRYSLSQSDAANAVEQAVRDALEECRTPDLATPEIKTVSTQIMTDTVIDCLTQLCK